MAVDNITLIKTNQNNTDVIFITQSSIQKTDGKVSVELLSSNTIFSTNMYFKMKELSDILEVESNSKLILANSVQNKLLLLDLKTSTLTDCTANISIAPKKLVTGPTKNSTFIIASGFAGNGKLVYAHLNEKNNLEVSKTVNLTHSPVALVWIYKVLYISTKNNKILACLCGEETPTPTLIKEVEPSSKIINIESTPIYGALLITMTQEENINLVLFTKFNGKVTPVCLYKREKGTRNGSCIKANSVIYNRNLLYAVSGNQINIVSGKSTPYL